MASEKPAGLWDVLKMNVLITGVQNHIEESIVRIAAERLKGKADFRLLSFSDFDGLGGGALDGLALIKATQQKVVQEVQAKMAPGRGGASVIVNGYCMARTKLGFFPVITEKSVKALRPDIMVHISLDPLALEGKEKDPQGFLDHQAVEKAYALLLCASAGCGLRIIHCGLDEARKASDELLELLKGMVADK